MIIHQLKRFSCLAFLALAGANLHAQVNLPVTITIAGSVQNPNQTDNGTITTTPALTKLSITTATILKALALAEIAEGNYTPVSGVTFPVGAKLVDAFTVDSAPDFQVLDKNNNLLVDVSDIITGTPSGNYGADVLAGKSNDNTGLSAPTLTDTQVYTITYDDSFSGVTNTTQFSITGLLATSTTDTAPNATTGIYKETDTLKLTSGSGDGNVTTTTVAAGTVTNSCVLTGTITMTGSASLGGP